MLKASRTATISDMCATIETLWEEMSFRPSDDFEASICRRAEGLGWSQAVVDKLKKTIASLQEQKGVREARIAVTGQEIMALWKRLGTKEEEQQAFLSAHEGLGDDVIVAVCIYLQQTRLY